MGSMSLQHAYLLAKVRVTEAGYGDEIRWQAARCVDDVSEQEFLRESAWVILSSGMRESVIRQKFPAVSRAFLHWKSARSITDRCESCAEMAAAAFAHHGKIRAILAIAEYVASHTFTNVLRSLRTHGVQFLRQFSYLGEATSRHLAKNLGVDVVKPDRHLLRIAGAAGFKSPEQLCEAIASELGDSISVVDVVFWRFATLERDYVSYFKRTSCIHRRARHVQGA